MRDTKIFLYHGTKYNFENPDIKRGRFDTDFGQGFYTSEDEYMAKCWVANKKIAYINKYELNFHDLKIKEFDLDEEWLDFVVDNRLGYINHTYDAYDILIGPTADDKLNTTIGRYMDDVYSQEQTIKYLNFAGYSYQIVLKSEKAIQNLKFLSKVKLNNDEKKKISSDMASSRATMLSELKKEIIKDRDKKRKERNR